ncbi:MAG: magnesium transporter [Chitinispirillales bacterium]|nr:magnesium transporter [Chitinispirillales bacterium]
MRDKMDINIDNTCTDTADKIAGVMPLVEKRRWIELRQALSTWPPPEVADFINMLLGAHRILVVRFLPRYFAAEVFSELSPTIQDELLTDLTNFEIRNLLADLEPDDRAALMDEMPAAMTRKLLNLLSLQDLKQTQELLGYPENSVGRIMTPNIVYIKESWTVREAIEHIREFGHDSETINMVYITDSNGTLIDEMPLSSLVLASLDDKVNSLMDYNVIALAATDSQESAVEKIKKYNYFALPVVDSAGVLLGIVTVDDLMDIADTHATEDFHRIGAVSVEAEGSPIENLKEASVILLYRRRITWLVLLIFAGILSGTGIAFFEDLIQHQIVLIFFLTLLIDCGGSSGTQSTTLMVRALATGDVKIRDWGKMITKEILVSGALGGVMAVAVAPLGIFRGGFMLAIVVMLSMFLIVMVGSLIGVCLPFILSKMKRDPAMASAPLVASVADIVGVLIYFSIATLLLR